MTYTDVAFAPFVGQETPEEGGGEEAASFAPRAQEEEVPAEGEPVEAPSAPEEAGDEEGEETPSEV